MMNDATADAVEPMVESSLPEQSKTRSFRSECQWFSCGLAALTFLVIMGLGLPSVSVAILPIAVLGAASTWLAGTLVYALTHSHTPPIHPVRLRYVVLHVTAVPFIAIPVASFFLGLLIGGFALKSLEAALFVIVLVLLPFAKRGDALLLIALCLVFTCAWSLTYLYLIRPKYFANPVTASTEA